jgi:hypothetical protein
MVRPLPTASPFAERFIDEPEEGEYEEPSREPSPFGAYVRARHEAALARMAEHGNWMWSTFFAVLLWGFIGLHTNGWWSVGSLALAVAIGLKWCYHFYEYRCARIESGLLPND